jgi:hypothetical protein
MSCMWDLVVFCYVMYMGCPICTGCYVFLLLCNCATYNSLNMLCFIMRDGSKSLSNESFAYYLDDI